MAIRFYARELLLLLVAGGAACGEDLPDDVPPPDAGAPPADAPSAEDAAADVGAVDAADAANVDGGFCASTVGWIACEDFERGLPPMRGFVAPVNGGLYLSDDAGDMDGGRAGRVEVDVVDAAANPPYARLTHELGADGNAFHLELVAKVENAGTGDFELAYLKMAGPAATMSISVRSQPTGALVYFCVDGACVTQNTSDTFAAWTPVVIDLTSSGGMSVKIGATPLSSGGIAISPVTSGSAWVGMVSAGTGGKRVVMFDDALVSSK